MTTESKVICSKCGSEDVYVYSDIKTAICPECFEEHDFLDGDCMHCGEPPPDDYYDETADTYYEEIIAGGEHEHSHKHTNRAASPPQDLI